MRIKLNPPQHILYSTRLQVRVTDLNYADHLSNDKILTYAHQARVELFAQWGCTELNFDGVGIIMTDAAVVFQSEGHLNDEIKIEVGIEDISKLGFDLLYQMSHLPDGKPLALVKTGIVCFDYTRKKVVAIPERILEILKK